MPDEHLRVAEVAIHVQEGMLDLRLDRRRAPRLDARCSRFGQPAKLAGPHRDLSVHLRVPDFLALAYTLIAGFALHPQVALVRVRRLVGPRARAPLSHDAPFPLDFVERAIHAGAAEVVEQLHAVQALHQSTRGRSATAPGFGMEGLDRLLQPAPRSQPVDLVEERLAPRPTAPQVVLKCGEDRLFSRSHTMQ